MRNPDFLPNHKGIFMRFTKLTVAGYDEDASMFAISVAAGRASVILTRTDEQGETARSMWQETVDTFEAVRDLVQRIVDVPVPVPAPSRGCPPAIHP
jgi:hypothetical protein